MKIITSLMFPNLKNSLIAYFEDSRFTFTVDYEERKGRVEYKLRSIRLKNPKPYCGNHPNACETTNGKTRKSKFLEGADWVQFDDMLNDWADEILLSATIKSTACLIRKGKERRVEYSGSNGQEWDYEGVYKDYTLVCPHPKSSYPLNTPGSYE